MAKRNALGRGLGALIDGANTINEKKPETVSASLNEVLLSQIDANPFQPRKEFDEDALLELASSWVS